MSSLRIPVFRPALATDLVSELKSCCESRWWGYGPRAAQLEQVFTANRGGWALATTSCTSALNLVAQLVMLPEGGEVIVPAITFVSTAIAFQSAGLEPVPVDVDPDTLMLDFRTVAQRITARTRAVVAVHLYGQYCDLTNLRRLCDAKGIALVEDCAHRIGDLNTAPVGDFACYSFNAVKEAPAGEGGLLWSRLPDREKDARELSYLGMTVDTFQRSAPSQHLAYQFGSRTGGKHRLTDIAATIVLASLREHERWRARRREIFAAYEEGLKNGAIDPVLFPRQPDDSYLMFVVRVPRDRREEIRRRFAERGIATSTHYPSLSRHPLWGNERNHCPVAESAEDELLTLPCFPDMDDSMLRRVTDAWKALD